MENADKTVHNPEETPRFKTRHATSTDELDELDFLVNDWAPEERWSVFPGDMISLRWLPSEARIYGTVNGEIITHITVINFDDTYSYITNFITKEEYRGKGFGKKVYEAALQFAGNRSIGLTCRKHTWPVYLKLGFCVGHVTGFYEVDHPERFAGKHPCLVSALTVSPDDLADFDQKYFPVRRKDFLQEWIRMPPSIALAFVEYGKILGYGVIHKRVQEKKGYIGPLFAESIEAARKVCAGLLGSVSGLDSVRIVMVENNINAKDFVATFDFKLVANGALMYKNGCPDFDAGGYYSMTSGLFG